MRERERYSLYERERERYSLYERERERERRRERETYSLYDFMSFPSPPTHLKTNITSIDLYTGIRARCKQEVE